jgi:hypothetical protein
VSKGRGGTEDGVITVNNEANDVLSAEIHQPRDQLAIRDKGVVFFHPSIESYGTTLMRGWGDEKNEHETHEEERSTLRAI